MPEPGFPGFMPEAKKIIQEEARLREDVAPTSRQMVDLNKGNEKLEDIQEDNEIGCIDFDGGDFESLEESGFKHAGPESYIISPISENNWYSEHYFDCTAVVAIGRDADTGKEISFMSHQDPSYFVDGGEDKEKDFSRKLSDSLKELQGRSQKDTVEVLLLGGNFNPTYSGKDYKHQHYKQSIEKLRRIVQDEMGFDPKVLAGPNNDVGSETIITVETQKRKVWIERSKQPSEFDESFQANELDDKIEEWSKKD